jgi:hypothetical protein
MEGPRARYHVRMNLKPLFAAALALGFTAPAFAAGAPLKLPTVHGYAVTMPGIVVHEVPMSMPGASFSVAAAVPAPGLAVSALPAPAIRWKATAIERAAAVQPLAPLVPAAAAAKAPAQVPAPAPASALDELRDSAVGREPIRTVEGAAFDGRRSARESDLPGARFF